MAISTYATLVSAVTEYLARENETVLNARIPDFITLCEAKLNRTLFVRQMEQRSTAVVDTTSNEPEFITVPTDFQSMRRIRLSSVTGKPCLQYRSGTEMDEIRFANVNAVGRPQFFTIMSSEIELLPTPDQAYTLEMVYRKYIPALTASNTTNWLLTLAPDIYLYGTMLEAMAHTKNDARLQVWGTAFSTTLDQLNNLNMTSEFNAGPTQQRISGVTP